MSVNTKMTAIADEIRTLSGTTDPMGLDAMATNVSNVNDEVSDQADFIDQIQTALQGKVAGGGNIQTCTVTLQTNSSSIYYYIFNCLDDNGMRNVYNEPQETSVILNNVVCGSFISFKAGVFVSPEYTITNGVELIRLEGNSIWYFSIPEAPIGDITITVWDND